MYSANRLGNQYYIEKFEKHVCSACKLCKPTFPAFCMSTYAGNTDRFFTMIKHIKVLQLRDLKALSCIYTFEGFCGLFCNSKPKCPNRTSECEKLGYVFSCYTAFVDQCGVTITSKVREDIWKAFSGVDTSKIGKRFRLPNTNPLKTLNKKDKKRINRLIKKTKVELRSSFYSLQKRTKLKKSKPIKTTFFCNDDGWEKKIDSYLENNETNNRQSAENA